MNILECLGKIGRIARPVGSDDCVEMASNTFGSVVREAFKESDIIVSGNPITYKPLWDDRYAANLRFEDNE